MLDLSPYRLPLQGVSQEHVLSPESVLESKTGQTTNTGRAVQEVTGRICLIADDPTPPFLRVMHS